MIPLWCSFTTNFLLGFVKLIRYIASAVNMISSNPCVGLSPRIKISFPLLPIAIVALAPKIITYFPMFPSGNKNSEQKSYPML